MEIVLIILEIFNHFNGSHVFLECEVEFVVYPVSVGFFKEVEEGLHFFEICTWRCCVFLR